MRIKTLALAFIMAQPAVALTPAPEIMVACKNGLLHIWVPVFTKPIQFTISKAEAACARPGEKDA